MEKKDLRWPVAVVYLLLAISFAMAVYTLHDLRQTRKAVLHTFMQRPMEAVGHQLDGFFLPLSQLSEMARDHAAKGLYDVQDTASTVNYFEGLLRHFDNVSSMGVADSHGYEFNLIRTDSIWRTRTVRAEDNRCLNHWGVFNDRLDSLLSSHREPLQADPRSRPWFTGAMEMNGDLYWTGPYLYNTDSLYGVTLSMRISSEGEAEVVALDVTLQRLSEFMSSIRIGQHGGGFLLTRDLEPISLTSDTTLPIAQAARAMTSLFATQLHHWTPETILSVELESGLWHGRFMRYDLDRKNHIYAAILMPESEMMREVNRSTRVIIIGMVLTLVFTIGMLILLITLRRANAALRHSAQQIERQNSIIAERNTELQESMAYAQRIQSVMLPSVDEIGVLTMSRLLMLYLPKESVSGDFYWARTRDRISYFAVADCTGHGVPGAMMSILGLDLLNASVGKDRNSLPENLLYQLRRVLIRKMSSGGNIAKDGMDIGLCRLDHNSGLLHYAGAFIPLLIIRSKANGDQLNVITDGRPHSLSPVSSSDTHHLYVIKGDRMPLGFVSHEDRRVFVGHQLQLLQDDSVYLMTDGFVDQFGGANDKKFGQRKLRQTLLRIEHLSMSARKAQLHSIFLQHKGRAEQVDDICILGFKCGAPQG
jgi:serine phosphatase RsbU (regulator of sigma subunit)